MDVITEVASADGKTGYVRQQFDLRESLGSWSISWRLPLCGTSGPEIRKVYGGRTARDRPG